MTQPAGPYAAAPGHARPHDPTLADPVSRLVARIIDVAIVVAGAGIVLGLVTGVQSLVDLDHGTGQVIGIVTAVIALAVVILGPFVYEWLMLARSAATVGKRIMKLRVVDARARTPVTSGGAAARAVSYGVLNAIPLVTLLDKLWLLWDKPNQQRLHDKPAGTVVVHAAPRAY